ncbi:hypothetical protein ACFFF5_11330 [Lederbergia wuyishanensis]|uniref:Uncharacterized protein n=1 Tax=Lederbergia wuyishanensis TaxID=1347903 RepID=A0ABU0D468_9BACI|nr:hypothetical protein [Lederbergia wuyishanensis]MCJ8008221.1 hypothetical protein [Lederbergia wuyishanensis]MDQ0343190.1 hypothetical protein [Lederbergia wuyishanensis]
MYTPNYYYNPYGYSYRGASVFYPFPSPFCTRQMFPTISTKQFIQSTEKYRILVNEANKLINKISTSPKLAQDIMEAAQKSNQQKVNQLIQSTGITVKTKTHFNPDGIVVELSNAKDPSDCCTLKLALRW